VAPFQRAGIEAALPNVARFPPAHIQPARVVVIQAAEGFCERVFLLRGGDQMNVMWESEISLAVDVAEEDVAAIIAALGDVMGQTGDNNARFSRHMLREYAQVERSLRSLCIVVTVPETPGNSPETPSGNPVPETPE
jgi:hypothetical protein